MLTLRLFRLYQASSVCSWLLASLLVIYSCSGNDSYGKDQLILETEGRFHGQLKLMVIAKIRSHLTPWPFSAEQNLPLVGHNREVYGSCRFILPYFAGSMEP